MPRRVSSRGYAVSKSGVIALAEVLRQELREDGINVAVLCPMRVATNIGHSGRNRADRFGGGESPEITDPSDDRLAGKVIGADDVAAQVLEGIAQRDPYIMTHAEGRAFVERRFARIGAAFDRRTA
jgi:short-subunit dehydrogenase